MQQKKKCAVFIDYFNLKYSIATIWGANRFDIPGLVEKVGQALRLEPIIKKIFMAKNCYPEHRLVADDFEITAKETKIIRNGNFDIKKINLDVELALSLYKTLINPKNTEVENFVIFSGDSDFTCLGKEIKKKNKSLSVVSSYEQISTELRKVADTYLPLEELDGGSFIEKNFRQLPTRTYHQPCRI